MSFDWLVGTKLRPLCSKRKWSTVRTLLERFIMFKAVVSLLLFNMIDAFHMLKLECNMLQVKAECSW